ncbi:hypothetical protein [Nocardia rhizosphaerae]|uniref:Uncharacterized protein n=1 Tax=Nocardia rhizosphaerae TaxID=1691571 RepID=A0ABV8LDN2_9NOCA
MTAMTDWQPTEWWAAFDEHGLLAYEGTDEAAVRMEAAKSGFTVRRLWRRTDSEWRPA